MPAAIAKLKHLRMSPKKVRMVADLIRGLSVREAEAQLRQIHRRAARPISKLLRSAVANSKKSDRDAKSALYISKITVDAGPSLKRALPRARGARSLILKRSSHITIELESKPGAGRETEKPEPPYEPTPTPTSFFDEGEKKKEVRIEKKKPRHFPEKDKQPFRFEKKGRFLGIPKRIFRRKAM